MQSTIKSIQLADQSHCTGCSACHDSCPTNSISFSYGLGIHAYPVINANTCISCGKCMKACPAIQEREEIPYSQKYYAAWIRDESQRIQSTSGGVGTAFGKYAISQNYKVYGVAFDKDWCVRHVVADSEESIELLRGSKYVQSETIGIYKAIKENLKRGVKVLFIGTPCQVAALKQFIPKDLSLGLVTCEIICHGVNSPKVWLDYKKSIEKNAGSSLSNYNFRSKSKGWQHKNGGGNLRVAYEFKNGKRVDVPAWKNQYHYWFGQHLILRESCLHCKYRTEQRTADLTIADFWGCQNIIENANCYLGVSAVIVSTEKGEDFFKNVPEIETICVDEKKTKNVLLGYVEKRSEQQINFEVEKARHFSKEYMINGYDLMVLQYPHPTSVSHFFNKIKSKIRMIYGK